MIEEIIPKSEIFWSLIGLLIVVICIWKTQQIYAVLKALKDPAFNELPEEEVENQVNSLTTMLYAYTITLMGFIGYSFVSVL